MIFENAFSMSFSLWKSYFKLKTRRLHCLCFRGYMLMDYALLLMRRVLLFLCIGIATFIRIPREHISQFCYRLSWPLLPLILDWTVEKFRWCISNSHRKDRQIWLAQFLGILHHSWSEESTQLRKVLRLSQRHQRTWKLNLNVLQTHRSPSLEGFAIIQPWRNPADRSSKQWFTDRNSLPRLQHRPSR